MIDEVKIIMNYTENGFAMFNGMRSPLLVNMVEDWSECRSRARAKRRARGFPQRVRTIAVPKKEGYIINATTIIMHPRMIEELMEYVNGKGKSGN